MTKDISIVIGSIALVAGVGWYLPSVIDNVPLAMLAAFAWGIVAGKLALRLGWLRDYL